MAHLAFEIASSLKLKRDFFTDEADDFFEDHERLSLGKLLRFAALLHDMGHVPFGIRSKTKCQSSRSTTLSRTRGPGTMHSHLQGWRGRA